MTSSSSCSATPDRVNRLRRAPRSYPRGEVRRGTDAPMPHGATGQAHGRVPWQRNENAKALALVDAVGDRPVSGFVPSGRSLAAEQAALSGWRALVRRAAEWVSCL